MAWRDLGANSATLTPLIQPSCRGFQCQPEKRRRIRLLAYISRRVEGPWDAEKVLKQELVSCFSPIGLKIASQAPF
jgi:hypothetical protein